MERCEYCNHQLWGMPPRCPNGCGEAPESEEMSPCAVGGGYVERPFDDHEGD